MQQSTDFFTDGIPFIMEGQVVSNSDPDQMGRVKVWIPALDGENFDVEQLPWAEYASPFAGFTVEYPAGNGTSANQSQTAYGFWAIPKIGATVMIFCLNANPASRFYFASSVRLHRNRSLPAGRNKDFNGKTGPFGDDGGEDGGLTPLEPAYTNLREQFNQKVDSQQAQSRGAWERQAAQHKNDKNGEDGYAKSPVDSYLDPQTYCIVTPGHHAIIMQDDPKGARLRFKTAEGHQIIFDDTNERIYMSTAKGKSWVELDQDGHIHVFGSESVSIRAGQDINMFADRDINIEANRAINIKANTDDIKIFTAASLHVKSFKDIKQSACGIFDIDSESSLKITAANSMDIKAGINLAATGASGVDIKSGGDIKQTGANIHLNGPAATEATPASCPDLATAPPVVPGHEPWTRPTSKQKRNAGWKE